MPNSDQVMRWAAITRRQLDNWVEKGYIKPSRVSGHGWSGTQFDWPMDEAKVVQRMAALTAAGIAPAMAARFARGERGALDKVLHALANCLGELRWRHEKDTVIGSYRPHVNAVPADPESCT